MLITLYGVAGEVLAWRNCDLRPSTTSLQHTSTYNDTTTRLFRDVSSPLVNLLMCNNSCRNCMCLMLPNDRRWERKWLATSLEQYPCSFTSHGSTVHNYFSPTTSGLATLYLQRLVMLDHDQNRKRWQVRGRIAFRCSGLSSFILSISLSPFDLVSLHLSRYFSPV